MVKISQLVLIGLVASATAFQPVPVSNRAFVRSAPSPLFMAEEADAEPESPGALVPIKEETVEFTAGLIGGAIGFAVGGPVIGAIGAALANYASKTDQEVGDLVSSVSKTAIECYNYLARLDAKYEVLNKAKGSLDDALEKVKKQDNVDPETIQKVETALKSTTDKIKEINDEYDLVGAGSTALSVVGDLVEKAVGKAGELNEEYELTSKAKTSLSQAVEKAKVAAKESS